MSKPKRAPCVLCHESPRVGDLFCERCGRAYDRWNAKADSTLAALIEWVARGARKRARTVRREP